MAGEHNGGTGAIRRQLNQRIESVLGEWQAAIDRGGWDVPRMMRIVAALTQLSEAAGKFQMEAPALVARDSAAYLGFLLDTVDAPNVVQQDRILNYLHRLQAASTAIAELLLREELDRPAVLALHGPEGALAGLGDALRARNWLPLQADAPGRVAELVKGRPLVGVVVDAHWLPQLGEIVDALDQNRRPGPTPPLLVAASGGLIGERLLGMTGSADAFLAHADAAGVVHKLADLQQRLSSTEPLRVLIVDDDRSQVVFCDAVLRRRGLSTQVASSAKQALELVQSFRPDLVLVDLYMPDIDGMALTARIREMPGTLLLPIVFISGEQDMSRRLTAINIGADDFLTKPVRPAHLIDLVVGRAKRARSLRRQVLAPAADTHAGPIARGALGARVRTQSERPAALISVGVEQSAQLGQKLPALLRCEMEQAIAGRIGARLAPGDAFAPWFDLHFLVLAARPERADLQLLVQSLRNGIDVRPLVVSRGQIALRARVQLVPAGDDPQRWLEQALAAWQRPTPVAAPAEAPAPESTEDDPYAGVIRADPGLCSAEYQPMIPARGMASGLWHQRLRVRNSRQQAQGMLRADLLLVARRAGTLAQLDRIALRLAQEAMAVQSQIGQPVRIHVEVDVATLLDPSILDCFGAATAQGLTIELDTDAVLEKQALLRPLFERLRALGVRLCLREFGMQRDAPRLLQQIQVDCIKLDSELALQPTVAFAAIMGQIHEAGVPIAVEDVGDSEMIARLWESGIDFIQCERVRGYGPGFDFDFGGVA